MKTHRMHVVIPDDHELALRLTLPEELPSGPAELIVYVEPERKAQPASAERPPGSPQILSSNFWQRAAELREATRGRKYTPSEDLIREDRDRDHRVEHR